jgi:hypothetical protein
MLDREKPENINITQDTTPEDGQMLKYGGVYIPSEMITDKYVSPEESKGKVPLMPMSPLVASSTVVNLLLATGPFT